jgi:Xaa-Pro aminopeptidase
MYPHQTERLDGALARAGADALVATSAANVAYLTGFHSVTRQLYPETQVFAVYAAGRTALVVPAVDAPAAAAAGDLTAAEIACYGALHADLAPGADATAKRAAELLAGAAESPARAVAGVLRRVGAGPIVGLDDEMLPAAAARAIAEQLGTAHALRPASQALAQARAVKGPYEIDCLQQALRIAEEAIHELLGELKAGTTGREAAMIYEDALGRRAARPWRTTIAFGPSAALPAAPPADGALRIGELVRIDVGCVFKGYYADVARTAVLGEPTPRQQQRYDAVDAGIDAALAALRPGAPAGTAVEASLAALRTAGLPSSHQAVLGHGIGLEPAEAPWLTAGTPALESGTVLCLESAHYELGAGAVHVKETVLLTVGGAVAMNRSNRGLVVLD